jgi:hypothetical protein
MLNLANVILMPYVSTFFSLHENAWIGDVGCRCADGLFDVSTIQAPMSSTDTDLAKGHFDAK